MKEFKRTKHNPTIGMTEKQIAKYWIQKSIDKYGDNFNYDGITSIKTKKDPIKITCKKHGSMDTSFNNHLTSGTGCYKCGDENCRNSKRMSFIEFLKRIDELFPDKSFKILSREFNNRQIKHARVYVQDEFGICKIAPTALLVGTPPGITNACFPDLYTINKYHKIHGYSRLDFSDCGYEKALGYIEVNCRKHGKFPTKPNWILNGQGCGKCYNERRGDTLRSNTREFVEKSIKRWNHPHKIYDRVIYTGAKDKVDILCEIHDKYYQITPNDHLTGYGCPWCGAITGAYSREEYIKKAKGRNGIMYLIRCFNDLETFYKIGITVTTVKERFSGLFSMPYQHEVLYEYICDAGCIWDSEKEHHIKYKSQQYYPNIRFAGHTECFDMTLPINEIINNLKEI